ncbi:MAG: hypothetical protein ACK4RK_01050 [Gemmataceae bacterium]
MNQIPGWIARGLPLSLALCLLGCGGKPTPEVTPVRGKVTYKGQPLATGTIVFSPDPFRCRHGRLAWSKIASDGSYQLQTGEAVGVAAGWYRVTVAAVEVSAPTPHQPYPVPRSLIPDKYRDPQISGLVCEVKAGQENGINFNLE